MKEFKNDYYYYSIIMEETFFFLLKSIKYKEYAVFIHILSSTNFIKIACFYLCSFMWRSVPFLLLYDKLINMV